MIDNADNDIFVDTVCLFLVGPLKWQRLPIWAWQHSVSNLPNSCELVFFGTFFNSVLKGSPFEITHSDSCIEILGSMLH